MKKLCVCRLEPHGNGNGAKDQMKNAENVFSGYGIPGGLRIFRQATFHGDENGHYVHESTDFPENGPRAMAFSQAR